MLAGVTRPFHAPHALFTPSTGDATPLRGVDTWLAPFRQFWEQRLDSLGTEIARGKRTRRRT